MTMPALASHPGDRDCPDFSTWRQAQDFFERHGGSSSNNADRLDADSDGDACETLPGYNGGGGNGDNGNGGGNGDNGSGGNGDNGNGGGDDPGEMPPTSTDPVSTGITLPLLLTALGLGTFGLMLRRRFSLQS